MKQKILAGMVHGFRIVLASVFIFSLGIVIPARAIGEPDLVILSYELRNAANNAVITSPNANEAFYIRMTIKNQGTAATGLFYPGVFLDDKPNYGPDTNPFGRLSDWSGYRITPAGSVNGEGCVYYDPTNSINPLTTSVDPERGNYTRSTYNNALDPDTHITVDVYIGYLDSEPEYNDPKYDPYRTGLPPGSYNIYLYADPNCSGGDTESNETNNSYGLITINVIKQKMPPADFDGDGKTDVSVFRPSNGTWYIYGQFNRQYGTNGDIPAPGDYNGDGKTDTAVFRPSNGTWYIYGQYNRAYGTSGDIPVPGDYNGDGKTDTAVFRPSNGTWYIYGQYNRAYGTSGDIPVPGDYNGDGKTDVAVFRPSNGVWYIYGQYNRAYGTSGDIPVPGDYNGDGKTDTAVFRPSTGVWYIYGQYNRAYGTSGDIPVPGDYNGDGKTDTAVFRPSNGTWYIYGQYDRAYGASGDIPVPGDYNGDGKTDTAVFRPSNGTWYIYGQYNRAYGTSGDIPIPGTMDR